MKEYKLLIWLTQLGLSIAMPLGGFTFLGLWLKEKFSLGTWAVIVFCVLGVACAVSGLMHTLRAMNLMEKNMKAFRSEKKEPPPVSYNDHV